MYVWLIDKNLDKHSRYHTHESEIWINYSGVGVNISKYLAFGELGCYRDSLNCIMFLVLLPKPGRVVFNKV